MSVLNFAINFPTRETPKRYLKMTTRAPKMTSTQPQANIHGDIKIYSSWCKFFPWMKALIPVRETCSNSSLVQVEL